MPFPSVLSCSCVCVPTQMDLTNKNWTINFSRKALVFIYTAWCAFSGQISLTTGFWECAKPATLHLSSTLAAMVDKRSVCFGFFLICSRNGRRHKLELLHLFVSP